MQALILLLTHFWSWILNCFRPKTAKNGRLRDVIIRLRQDDGSYADVPFVPAHLHAVSRHGLLQQGIICPSCGALAVRPGDFEQVHRTRFGEAVHCQGCLAILLASPDDAIDPVSEAEPYNEEVYHTFARVGHTVRRVKQRTASRPAVVGDWIVFTTHAAHTIKENPQPPTPKTQVLFGSEGRVDEVGTTGLLLIAVSGNHGIGGAGGAPMSGLGGAWIECEPCHVAVVADTVTLRVGDEVNVLRGPFAGTRGRVLAIDKGNVEVQSGSAPAFGVPIERIEKIVL